MWAIEVANLPEAQKTLLEHLYLGCIPKLWLFAQAWRFPEGGIKSSAEIGREHGLEKFTGPL
ncbi:MAG: hypothetical protein LBJ70_02250 [Holosporales bacterium]|jgi:hypothetical protein|nr:hypothetical protein [Holosporales bacterium]